MGELIKMFRAMVTEATTVLVLLSTFVVAFGIAFSALMAPSQTDNEFWRRPFWYGAWALYGDFDVEAVYDQLGGDNFLNFTVAMLLWIYTGLTTIFLVNLMIAQVHTLCSCARSQPGARARADRAHQLIRHE